MKPEIEIIPHLTRVTYDVYAGFPAAGNRTGDLAYATDLRCLYYWNGVAWVVLTIYSLAGLAADIPAAATLPNGSIYFTTDTEVFYIKQGAAWLEAAGKQVYTVYKTDNETINNSIALQNDNELFFPIAAGEVWEFEIFLHHTSTAIADFKLTILAPAEFVTGRFTTVLTMGNPNQPNASIFFNAPTIVSGTGANAVLIIKGVVMNGGNAGNIQLQWAQNIAEVSNTTVYTTSYLKAINIT